MIISLSMTITEILEANGTGALSSEDRQKLCQWNGELPSAVNRCAHDLIHEVAQAQPDAPAVCAWDGSYSYREIVELASRLAIVLTSQYAVKPETFVPIYSEKSKWVAIAMLAVIQAGGAIVLLDPCHPTHRLREIYSDIRGPVILASEGGESLATRLEAPVLLIPEALAESPEKLHLPKCNYLSPSVHPSNALYVVFTSGSTGKPKGAVVTHLAFATAAAYVPKALCLGPDSRIFQFSSYAFDVAIGDHLLTWAVGGCVCIPSDKQRLDDLPGALAHLQANWVFLTPSVSRLISPTTVRGLKCLLLGGEAVHQADIDQWAGQVQLLGDYGPAECALTAATVHPTLGNDGKPPTTIGRGVGVVCWVVAADDPQRLVPIGTEGELLLEGHTLCREYVRNEEQTATAFVNNPQWLRRPARLYKTGDLVRYLSDGSLQYLGRRNTQVKRHGQRIELGEIEHHSRLCCPEAQDAVAEMVPVRGLEDHQLVLFLGLPGSQLLDVEEKKTQDLLHPPSKRLLALANQLRQVLQSRLLAAMMPDLILPVTKIPLTPTGKTDRRRLRQSIEGMDLTVYRDCLSSGQEGPIGPVEQALALIWSRLLNVPEARISRQDNWFRLGGGSLLAMRLVSQAADVGLSLSLRDIFDAPTLAMLAEAVRLSTTSKSLKPPAPLELVAISTTDQYLIKDMVADRYQIPVDEIEDIYPCSELQKVFVQTPSKKLTVLVETELPSHVDLCRLASAWQQVQYANPVLRTRIAELPKLGYLQLVMREGSDLKVHPWTDEHSDIWGFNRQLISLAVNSDNNHLRLQMHHTLYDLYALGILFQQLHVAYQGGSLPYRPYSTFIQWVSQTTEQTDTFWRDHLAGFSGQLFPAPPPNVPSVTARFPPRTLDLGPSANAGISAETTLRLALAIALAAITGQSDNVFSVVRSRRGAPLSGIAETVGPTTSMTPWRVILNPEASLHDSLKKLQDEVLTAVEHECTSLMHIASLSPETASACRSQTMLLVQPDKDNLVPPFFSSWRLHEDTWFVHALALECILHPGHKVVIAPAYDPSVVETAQVESIVDWLIHIAGLVATKPKSYMGDLLPEVFHRISPSVNSDTHHLEKFDVDEQPHGPFRTRYNTRL